MKAASVLRMVIVVLALFAVGAADRTRTPGSTWSEAPPSETLQCIPADQCCKVCDKGQACGNSCISRKYNCHKGRGCACNADEICE